MFNRRSRTSARSRSAPASGAATSELQASRYIPEPSCARELLRAGRPRSGNAFGARPPRALQRPNCKRRGISQRHRVLGSCCGRGARAPGRWREDRARRNSGNQKSQIKNLKFEFPWPHPSTTPLARRSFPAKAASLHLPSPHERSPKTNHPQTFGRA